MVKRFLRRANSILLAAAMTATLMPAQIAFAADGMVDSAISLQQAEGRANGKAASALDLASITGKEYTVIQGNVPALPKRVVLNNGTAEITWPEWDTSLEAGKYTVTGTANNTPVAVTVNVLPCDEVVEDVRALGTSDSSTQEKSDAIHPLKGYKGLFVTEYDIVPEAKYTHDRAVIYLPEAMDDGTPFHAENCWDTGARLQFKYSYNEVTYFQTQNGDGQVVNNAQYYPTNDELNQALESGTPINALSFDETNTYRVCTVMDTATDKAKGNFKVYITDPDGIEHEVTKEGGNGFRIYPKDGIVKNFAAVRGSYRLVNHKVSWLSGYATKKVEVYLQGQNSTDYAKEAEDIITKELPGAITEQPDREIIRGGQSYTLDMEKSGWYHGEEKVASVTAQEGETVTYRAYYNNGSAIDKTALSNKIQEASSLAEEDYTAASWKVFADALTNAGQVNAGTSVSQSDVDEAVRLLDTAKGDLVSIKNLKASVNSLKAALEESEGKKYEYTNWDEVKGAVESAEKILAASDATKAQVEAAEESLKITLIVNDSLVSAKNAMERSVAAAEQKFAQIKEADYTPASWKALNDALRACKSLDPSMASASDYDAKKEALDRAMNNLVKLVKVKSIKPAAKTYKIAAGKKLNVKKVFTVSPANADNNKLTYSIDKKYSKYASIKSGVVTVKSAGAGKTVAVKAKAADGSGKTATVKIKIMKNAVTKITVKKNALTVKAGKKVTIKPVVKTNGKIANKTLAYTSSNEKIATVKNGVVTAKKGKKGKVTITIKSTDGTNKSVKVKVTVKK